MKKILITLFCFIIYNLSLNIDNCSAQWVQISNGIGTNHNVEAIVTIGNNIFVGINNYPSSSVGVFLSINNGTSWTAVNNGLTNLNISSLAVSGTKLFAGTWGGGVFLSTNNGTSWTSVNSGLTNLYITALSVSGVNIFAGTSSSTGIFLSTNNGTSWTSINSGLPSGYVYTLAISGTNIFAGIAGGVFLTTNNGTSWTSIGLTSQDVWSLAISGTNIFAGTYFNGIFLSTNIGTSWTTINYGLTNLYVLALTLSQLNIFAGTGMGVFLSTNNGTNWSNISSGFNSSPYVRVLHISNNNIFAGIIGQSVWKRPLSDILSLQAPSNPNYDRINNRLIWSFSPSSNVAKYLVYKKGSDNIWKSLVDSGGMVNSNINYYNIQTCGYNYYRVAAISNIGDTAKSDSVYVNRGFVLRNLNSGTVESFKVNKHGFSFGNHDTLVNGEPLMWNSFWYSQFNYQNSPYPYYFRIFSKSADYPDWPLFTIVYGRNKCYLYYYKPGNIIDSSFIRKSVAKWHNITYYPIIPGVPKIETWRGTCFGFSLASLLAFYHNSAFYTQFPIMNNVDSTYGILPSIDVKKMINHLQTTQNFVRKKIPENEINQNPNVILNLLESRFSKIATSGKLNGILGIYKIDGGGHAVVPYAIEKISDSIKYLYIYDNECPSVDTARLRINTIANTCRYNMNDSNYMRMLLVDSLESCLGEQNFDNSYHKFKTNENLSNDSILFFNSSNNTSLYLDINGDTITGFRITDNTYLGNKKLGFSPMTDGRVNPPIYYKIPYTGYLKVIFKDFITTAGKSYLSFDLDSATTYKIERTDSVQSNQSDFYLIDSGYFSFINYNNIQKKINLLTIITETQNTPKEKSFDISNFTMILNDSVQIKRVTDNLVIRSKGTAKMYALGLNLVDTSGNKTFHNPSVSLASNSTHIISPVWDSIKTRPVKIFVDLGNNGTIDDTLLIIDTILTKTQNKLSITPINFALYQNYPNPFNPITKISFDSPITSRISLKVYDILGREIETLINDILNAGSYSINWDAKDYPSGIYLYRIQADNFIETRRMILLK